MSYSQAKHRFFCSVLVGVALVGLGCHQGKPKSTKPEKGVDSELEKRRLESSIKQLEQARDSLQQQVNTLAGLPEAVNKAQYYQVKEAKLSKYTGLYDKDRDGACEKLIVYIKPIDQDGDIIKAAGRVTVQLWDLNSESAEALLGSWTVEPEQLRTLWFAAMMNINYRLVFDLPAGAASRPGPLTVKVAFTDLLSGVVFNQNALAKKH